MPVKVLCGNILEQPAEALVLPCNGSGIMGFVSLAGEVRRFMGRQLYLEYRKLCPMQVGDVHLIDASPSARQKKVLLACTMILPGTPIPLTNVTRASRAILRLAWENGISSLAWPLLGSGGGRIDGRRAYEAIVQEIQAYREETGYDPEIYIVEKSPHKVRSIVEEPVPSPAATLTFEM